ncbi:MAG: FAD-binding oxidoreductase [Allobranchiibius sp.]
MSDESSWDQYPFRVLRTTARTPVIRELKLSPQAATLAYNAGQYVLLNDMDYRLPPRSYSIANAPQPDGQVSLLVTLVPDGATSRWVHERLRVGEQVALTGPYGTFVPDPRQTGPVLLLAAGSGLAPARALCEELLDGFVPRPVTLFFSARTRADTIDHDRFCDLADSRDDFRYLLTLTRADEAPQCPHVPDLLADAFEDLSGWEVFASGPPGFVAGCAEAAQRLGAEPGAVHTEEFFADPQPWTELPPITGQRAER